jgi:hypothetical protein
MSTAQYSYPGLEPNSITLDVYPVAFDTWDRIEGWEQQQRGETITVADGTGKFAFVCGTGVTCIARIDETVFSDDIVDQFINSFDLK